MFYGLLNPSWIGYIVITLAFTHITIVSVTVFLHRAQAHGALRIHPALAHFFRMWLWLTTGMLTKEWVAIHRKHHARCETEEDPHSPQIYGLPTVLWRGVELYRKESRNPETLDRYGFGTPDDWMEKNVYTAHAKLGIILMFIFDLVFFGIPGITVWAIQMMWIPFFAAGVINGVGHFFGYRNFECADAATNIVPWAILIGGEELHNNHHTYPTSAKLSIKWWEFDLGWFYIKLFSLLGLAQVKRVSPRIKLADNKRTIDAATVKAIVLNRFQIMANYTQQVLLPVFKEEKRRADVARRSLFDKNKAVIIRSEALIDAQSRNSMLNFLQTTKALEQVYVFKQNLQDIWSRTTASQRELLEAVDEWCQRAEKSDILALRRFAGQLKQYN